MYNVLANSRQCFLNVKILLSSKKNIENALVQELCNFTFQPRYPSARLFGGRRFALVFIGDGVIGKDLVAAIALLDEQNSPPSPIGIVGTSEILKYIILILMYVFSLHSATELISVTFASNCGPNVIFKHTRIYILLHYNISQKT